MYSTRLLDVLSIVDTLGIIQARYYHIHIGLRLSYHFDLSVWLTVSILADTPDMYRFTGFLFGRVFFTELLQ